MATRAVYFVGTDPRDDRTIAIFRGLPYDLPFGIELYERFAGSGVTIDDVPRARRSDLHGSQAALEGRRGEPRDRARARPDRVSARNRELFALVPASLLVAAGFAALFIQQSQQLSDVSLTYGAMFLGVCVAAHLVVRIRLPYADPYLLPLVAVMACFGLVVIYRLDEEKALRQAGWFGFGLILFTLTIVFLQGLPRARALPLHDRGGRPGAAAAAARARHRPAGQRRLPRRRHRGLPVPAGGVRQARDRHLPRRLPARHAAVVGAGRAAGAGRDDPAAQALRAAARGLGRGDVPALLHPGPGLVADVLRRLPGPALRGHQPRLVRDDRAGPVRVRRLGHVPDPRPHPGPRGDLARPVQAVAGRGPGLPDRAVAVRPVRRRAVRHRLRPGAAVRGRHAAAAGGRHRPDLRRDRQRARAGRARAGCCSSTCCSASAG